MASVFFLKIQNSEITVTSHDLKKHKPHDTVQDKKTTPDLICTRNKYKIPSFPLNHLITVTVQ